MAGVESVLARGPRASAAHLHVGWVNEVTWGSLFSYLVAAWGWGG